MSSFEPWVVLPIAQAVAGGPWLVIGIVAIVVFVGLVMDYFLR